MAANAKSGPAPLAKTPLAGDDGVDELPTQEAAVLLGHEGAVLAVRFNRDGQARRRRSALAPPCSSQSPLRTLPTPPPIPLQYCLTCGQDRTLRLWNPHKGEQRGGGGGS